MAKKNFIVNKEDLTTSMASAAIKVMTETVEAPPSVKITMERPLTGKNKGLRAGEERISFILLEGQYEKLKEMAYLQRSSVKDLVIGIFDKAIEGFENS